MHSLSVTVSFAVFTADTGWLVSAIPIDARKLSRTRDFPSQSVMLIRKINATVKKIERSASAVFVVLDSSQGVLRSNGVSHDRDQRDNVNSLCDTVLRSFPRDQSAAPGDDATRREAIQRDRRSQSYSFKLRPTDNHLLTFIIHVINRPQS